MDSSSSTITDHLLEAAYHEGCPGCDVERRKATRTGMPLKEFFFVGVITLCAALPISSLFPFLYFMIRDLDIAKREEDIGFYAGFVGSAYMLGRALTSMVWGIAADRYGRKPIIMFGFVTVIIFNTIFGLSINYWMALSSRFLLGMLNGILGNIKAYSSEVCRPEHQSVALSIVNTGWGIGLIVGPAIGGYLAQPAEKYPQFFSNAFFLRFPYFLPCIFISVLGFFILLGCFWLPETLHNHDEKLRPKSYEALEAAECSDLKEKPVNTDVQGTSPKPSLLKNWPLMSSIILYCVFSLHDMAYTEIFSLWAESDKKYGGLSFSTKDVGDVLVVSGFALLVFQLFLYPPVEKILGPIISARIAAILSIPLLASYPFFTYLSGVTLKLIVNVASLSKNVLSISIITGMFILQNNAVEQNQRGAANGLAMTLMSFFKAVAPATAGAIFSFAQKRQEAPFLPGDQLVFFVLNMVELLGLILTFNFFMRPPPPK